MAGFLAGLIGTGGAIRGLALAAFNLEKGTFVATSAAIDFGVDFSRMLIYLRAHYLAADSYWYAPGLCAVAFGGSYVGKLLLARIEQRYFRNLVVGLVFLIGLITLIRFLQQAFR